MSYEALVQENKMLRQTCERLQEEKEELIRINANNFNEYDLLFEKYRNLQKLKGAHVPEIMRKEVSE